MWGQSAVIYDQGVRMKFIFGVVATLIAVNSFASKQVSDVNKSLADQIRFKVTKYQLKNGLTVLLHEDHSAPLISYHQWFRVGSKNEQVGRTGLAHFFEHLMFKGTKTVSAQQFEALIRGNGGYNNAFTSKDYTGYFEDMPSGTLGTIAKIEADRMRNLVLRESEIISEREVVKEERRMRVEDSVMGSLNEAIFKSIFRVHPYRWPIVGYMRDLNAASMDDLREFYRVHYAPNNAVLVITGDFDTDEAKAIILKEYGAIPSQKLPVLKIAKEPKQTQPKLVTIRKNVQSATVAVVFKVPKAGERETYVLDLLSNILGEGTSSRLHRRVVYRNQTGNSVSVSNYSPMEAGIFQVTAAVKAGVDENSVLKAVYSEIYKVRKRLVSEKELQKAKNQIMKGYVDSLGTISGKARGLAINEIFFGDYEELFKDLDKFQSVTREEVKSAAEKYLQPSARSVIKVLPKIKVEGV